MFTDDKLAERIGPRLRAELADLPVPDLLSALHRRQARRVRIAAGLTALPVAAALAVSLTLATSSSRTAGPAPRASGHAAAPQTDTVIKLDGFTLGIPPGVQVRKLGAGFEANGPDGTRLTIFLESRPRPLPFHGTPVAVGSRRGWWIGQRGAGELIIPLPARNRADYLVAKGVGPSVTRDLMVSFASRIDFGRKQVIRVACPPNCG